VYLQQLGLACALGRDRSAVAAALFAAGEPGGLVPTGLPDPDAPLMLGPVPGELALPPGTPLPLQGRNNGLLELALADIEPAVREAIARHGADRVAVVLGTSTSGVGESGAAHR